MKRKSQNSVPDRDEFVWVSLSPTSLHEQTGRRPVLVVSPKNHNLKTGLCVLCPATQQAKGYPFEVTIADANGATSVVLADHLHNVDWKVRDVQFVHRVSDSELAGVVSRIEALLVNPDI